MSVSRCHQGEDHGPTICPYLAGQLSGLLSSGILFLLLSPPRGAPIALEGPPPPAPIRVHVAGSVRNPGVYELERYAIVAQAIEAAGGPLTRANLEPVNLAATLNDGAQVTIPSLDDESETSSPVTVVELEPDRERLDLNSASAPELERLPGIGPSLAEKIVDHRDANGPFHQIEDLLNVSGIGPAKLDAIRDLVEVR